MNMLVRVLQPDWPARTDNKGIAVLNTRTGSEPTDMAAEATALELVHSWGYTADVKNCMFLKDNNGWCCPLRHVSAGLAVHREDQQLLAANVLPLPPIAHPQRRCSPPDGMSRCKG
jgi:hypothetical protein